MISSLTIIAFTHKALELRDLGLLILEPEKIKELNPLLKKELDLDEFFLLNTCNRVELVFTCKLPTLETNRVNTLINLINPDLNPEMADYLESNARTYSGLEAMNHLLKVSCSLDSMVVGEKEILAQLRHSYEFSKQEGFTGDILRLVMDQVVKAAKEVYTHTKISQKPISVVSIAFRKLKSLKLSTDAKIWMIGSGKTNTLFSKYLVKHGFKNFVVFNRTLENGEILARELNGKAKSLKELGHFKEDFDLLVVCTDSATPIITKELYANWNKGKSLSDKKILIDLSVPSNIAPEVINEFPVHYIDIKSLQELASENMDQRYQELFSAEKIIESNLEEFQTLLRTRKVELAMSEVPQIIKGIKEQALNTIFAKDVELLDPISRETLEKVLNYMEKKYISIPMVLAKEILVNS